MTKATFIALAATLAMGCAGAAAAQSYTYGGVGYGAEYRGDYASGSVYGRGSYSSESRHYDSGWRRADGYAPYPAPGYGGGYYAQGRTGGYVDGRYGYDYRYGAPYAQGYGYSYGYGDGRSSGYGHDRRHDRYDRGGRYGYSHGQRYDNGYRDWYGYNDDRPSSRAVYDARDYYGRGYDCRCSDVYLYDR